MSVLVSEIAGLILMELSPVVILIKNLTRTTIIFEIKIRLREIKMQTNEKSEQYPVQ